MSVSCLVIDWEHDQGIPHLLVNERLLLLMYKPSYFYNNFQKDKDGERLDMGIQGKIPQLHFWLRHEKNEGRG